MKKTTILDTTLRDGEQTQGVSFTPKEKLSIAKILLSEVKVDWIEVASTRVSKGELAAVQKISKWAKENGFLEKLSVLGFVDGNKSVDWAVEAGVETIWILAKGSLLHIKEQLRKSPEEHLKELGKTFDYAKSKGLEANLTIEIWSNGMLENKDFVKKLVETAKEKGVKKASLCDTLGILTPEETKQLVEEMVSNFPDMAFEFHAHNDYGLAVANSLAATKAGCATIHATVNGLGERAGNTPLDELAVVLNDKTEFGCNIEEKMLSKASKVVETFSGKRISANKPVTGSNVFTQTAGIHADGDKKAGLYKSKLRPERFGKERQYALGKLSGKASIDQNLEKLGLNLGRGEKEKLLKRIVELGDKKKAVTAEDLPFIVSDLLGTPEKTFYRIANCQVSSGTGIKPTASFTLEANGKEFSESAVGDGGYNAFMNALAKVSKKAGIKLPKLLDYEVRIPPGGKTDALVETTITWKNNGKSFSTVGIDSDQVMAAIKATEKMMNIVARKKEKGL